MEKILKDRLNMLKSKRKEYANPKMDKHIEQEQLLVFDAKIEEVHWMLSKVNTTNMWQGH
jgi:hypothetical protein